MSQQGPASHHASRRSSRSPIGDDQTSPSSTRYGGRPGSRDMRPDQGGIPRTNGDSRAHQIPPRTLGVHNILNPSEPHPLMSEGISGLGSSSRPQEQGVPTSTPGSTPGPFTAPRPFFPGQAASISLPGTPVGSLTPQGGPASERNSPMASYPFPAMNNPRRMLSPKPPRAASLSHGGPPRELDTRQLPSIPSVSPAKRSYEVERPDDHRAQLPGLHHMPQGPQGQAPAPARQLSQSVAQSPGLSHALLQGNAPVRPSQHMPSQPAFHPGLPSNRPFQSPGPTNEGAPPWSEMMRRHGMGGAMGTEGQQAFMTLPGSDTPIPVQVDYSQASKKADEKRQRNAVASTRHRRKKKILQEENSKQLQELRDERRHLEILVEAVTRQRDFYRDERNRMRDVIAQTPGIQGHAAGPPSPSSARSSFAERSPLVGSHQGPSLSQGYASETSSAERPTQRRRTDEHPEFSMPIYGTPTGVHPGLTPGPPPSAPPTGLPPMQGQVYGAPTRPPSAASSGSGERLPPIRIEGHPPGPGLGPGQGQEQDPRTGQWVPAQPRQQETGWATAPRRPPEGPTR
ncbi:Fc.00g108870.m01.CDS01 [Cosmosporella sp. VM-42]